MTKIGMTGEKTCANSMNYKTGKTGSYQRNINMTGTKTGMKTGTRIGMKTMITTRTNRISTSKVIGSETFSTHHAKKN